MDASFLRLRGALLIIASAIPGWAVSARAAVEYTSQNSATTCYHSAICTTTGNVWDTSFASYFNTGIGGTSIATGVNYNEAAFDFNECFGGGMIDELTTLNLVPAAYTSAAASNQLSWGFNQPSGTWESSYNIPFMTSVGAGNQMSKAASSAHDADIFGPVAGPFKINGNTYGPENPQYTSSGPLGDGIVLGGQDANGNPVANNKYVAVLFAGNDINPAQANAATTSVIDYNSLLRTYNTLVTTLNYNPANIYIMYPSTGGRELSPGGTNLSTIFAGANVADATAGNLKSSLTTWLAGKTTATTQVFYWNGMQHGTNAFDLFQYAGNSVTNATKYTFNLTQSFIQQVQTSVQNLLTINDTNPDDFPTIEVDTTAPITSPLDIYLDGDASPLALTDTENVDGDGSLYQYDYELSSTDDADLETTGDNATFDWSSAEPDFSGIYLTEGDGLGDQSDVVPEPASASLLALVACGLVIRRRKSA